MNHAQLGLLSAFLEAGVEFAVVGGVAVNIHGYVRATYDLDIFIRPSVSNAEAAFRALQTLGAPIANMTASDLLGDEEQFRFANETQHIDILASIGEMSFDQVWAGRVEVDIGGYTVPCISKTDLLQNKRQVGRLRDLNDVEELEALPDGP